MKMQQIKEKLKDFFSPPSDSPRWALILPYAVLGILTILVVVGGAYGWNYTNSPGFCADGCHTMPPQGVTYEQSPHANVYCTECHIGRAFVGTQLSRKTQDVREIIAMVTASYEYPLRATRLFPSRETCEQCHLPEKFSDDSLRTITHFANNRQNTETKTYLIMKTGGGNEREGLGLGIHWHVANKIEYYSSDGMMQQEIPFIRVHNADGTTTEYVDIESGFEPASVEEAELHQMDCIACHNRIAHDFNSPEDAMDDYMSRGLISADIPDIHMNGAMILRGGYETREEGLEMIAELEDRYKQEYSDFYSENSELIQEAVVSLQHIYSTIVFQEQEVDWTTYPNNIGHMDAPGCFRCHDGKHLNEEQEAIRLECNICHSIPVVVGKDDFVTNLEISHGLEPESHLNPSWINLHNQVFDQTCSNCHTVEDPGGTSNTSFCSNSACHGNVYIYAGFDAPSLRELLVDQLPGPDLNAPAMVAPLAEGELPTYQAHIAPILSSCAQCHGEALASAGLNLSSYAGLMAGGENGEVIQAGDSAGSLLIEVQSQQHFVTMPLEYLEIFKAWIDAGALDN